MDGGSIAWWPEEETMAFFRVESKLFYVTAQPGGKFWLSFLISKMGIL